MKKMEVAFARFDYMHGEIKNEINHAIKEVVDSNWFIGGKGVKTHKWGAPLGGGRCHMHTPGSLPLPSPPGGEATAAKRPTPQPVSAESTTFRSKVSGSCRP